MNNFYTTKTARLFSEMDVRVAVSDKGERFRSHDLKPSTQKANAPDHIPPPTVETFLHMRFCQLQIVDIWLSLQQHVHPAKSVLQYFFSQRSMQTSYE